MIHELKTWPEYFNAILRGDKTFELRVNDRDFNQGDELLLKEWVPKGYWDKHCDEGYTGRILHRYVSYILKGPCFGIEEEHVIMSLKHVGA